MGELVPMPTQGDVFEDVRGDDRTMRVTCHPERDTVVVSLWVDRICRASFRLSAADVPRLMATLEGAVRTAERVAPTGGEAPAAEAG